LRYTAKDSVGRINTRRVAVVSADWWLSGGISAANCIAAYQPKGAVSYAASKVNLANPGTYNATEGTAPAFDTAVGWTFNGTTMFLETGIVPDLSAQAWSVIVRSKNRNERLL
jgi:hypothetical protein